MHERSSGGLDYQAIGGGAGPPGRVLLIDDSELFLEVVLTPEYSARLHRHYQMVKEALRDPTHPIHQRIDMAEKRGRPAPAPPPPPQGLRRRGGKRWQ